MKLKICKQCQKEYTPNNTKFCSYKCLNKFNIESTAIKKKKVREAKKISPKVLYKQNVELAKKIAKLRDNYTCQKCTCKENIHWSHIINEWLDHRLATYEENIKALCYHCHLNWWHKNPLEASEWFNNKFPWRYELLNKLHLEYAKEWKITQDWHLQENIRLKNLLKEYES